ncbi:DUF6285 domain-containing protein [Pseudomonas synxantha]|uniref:DUF6285 domain-containing protein n=1 Tax=Pseudomonas synxantha TaxID=47883 RepID=A0A5D3G9Z9_9PSED|nr:DUF6285 domain-containing protein [Pseudomonas synxantha]TYK57887.1 hypothetical protein FXO26_11535 [Pseudomonas synxantha]
MRDHPYGHELLESARDLLREEVLQALPADKRLAALMIANAMGIVARQLVAGDAPEQAELARLGELLRKPLPIPVSNSSYEYLKCLNRMLCEQIRAGQADPSCPRSALIFNHLREVARYRLMESNPKYLELRT